MPLTIIKSDPRAREKPCLRCGYSLRKITDSNYCPECGLSVWLSLNQNDTLEMSRPEWIRQMTAGLWILVVASLLALVALAPVTVREFRYMVYRQRLFQAMRADEQDPNKWIQIARARPVDDPNLMRVILLGGAAAFAAYQAGLLVLTSDEKRYPDHLSHFRIGARVVTGLAALAIILMFLQMLHPTPWGFPEWMTRLTTMAGAMLTWGYLHRIARRMPHKTLSRVAGWMMVVPLASLAYSFIRNSDWMPNVIPLLFLAVSTGLFVWFALVLRQTGKLADRNWASESADGGNGVASA